MYIVEEKSLQVSWSGQGDGQRSQAAGVNKRMWGLGPGDWPFARTRAREDVRSGTALHHSVGQRGVCMCLIECGDYVSMQP